MTEIRRYKKDFKQLSAKESRRCKIYSLRAKESLNVIKKLHQELTDQVDTHGFNNPKVIKKLHDFIDHSVTQFKNQIDCQEEETANEILTLAYDVLRNTFTADFPELQFKIHSCAANLENALGHNEASLDYLKQALRHAEEYEKTTRNYIGLNSAQTYLNVANALFYLARFQEAFTYAEQADEAANRAIAQLKEIQTSVNLARFDEMDPEDVEANIIIRLDLQIMSWLLQGKTLEKLNMFDRSAMCLRNGKQILVENFGPQHPLNADFEEVLAIVEKQLELEKEIYNIDEALLEQNALLGEPIHNTYTRSALMQKGRILSYREEESETVLQPAKTLEELRAEYEAGLEKKEDDHNCRRRLKVLIQKRQMIDQQYQFEEMMLMTQPIQIPQHLPMQHQQPYETRESTIDAQRTITTAEKVERHIDDDAFSPQEQLQRVSIVDPELIVNPIPLSDEWATETIEFTTQQKIYGVTVFEEKFNPDDNLEYEGIPSKNLREKSQFSKVLKVITEDHEMFKSLHKQSHSEIIKLNPDTPGSTFVEDQSKPEAYRKHIWQIVHDMVKDTDTTNQTISDEELKLIIEWEARQIITADEYGDNSREIVYITDSMEPKTDPKIITLNHLLPPERVYKTKLVKMNLKALAKIQAYVRGFCVRSAMRKFEWVLISDWLFKDQAKEQYFFVKVFRNNGVAINANYKVVVSSKRFIDNWRTRMFESLPCLDQEVQVYFKKALTIVYDKKEEFFMEDFNIATLPKATVVEKLPVKKSGMGEIQIGEIDFITDFKEPPTGFRGTIEIKRFRLLDKWTVALSFVAQMAGKEEKGEKKNDKKEKKGKEGKEKGKKDKTKEKKDKAPKDKKDKKDKKPNDKKDKSKSKDKKKDPKAEKSNVTITRFFRVDVSFFHAASRQTTADYINLKQLPTQLRYMALYLRDHLHVYMNEGDTAINYASLGSSRSKMPFEEMIATLERDFVEKEEPVQKVKEAVNEAIVDIMHAANDEFGKFEILREGVEFIVQVRFIKSLKMPWRIFVFQKTNLNNSDFVQLTHLQERGKDLEKFLRQKLCIYFDPVTKLIDYVCLASLKHLQKPPLVHFMVYHKKRWFSLLLEQNDDDPQEPYRLSVMADKSNETAAHKKLRNIATQNKRILCALYGDNILLSSHKNAQDYPETVINYKSEFGKVAEEEVSLNTFVMEQENLTYSVEVIKKKHAVNSWTIVVQQVDSVSFGMVVLDELEVLQYEREAYLRQHLQIRLNANKTIKYVRLNYPVERKEIAVDAPKDKMDGIPDWVIHKLQLRGLQIRLKKLKAEREKGLICRFKIFKENKRDVDVLIEVRQGEALETKKDREIRKKQQIIMNERDGKIEEDIEESQEVANEKFETKTVILFQIKAINQRNLNNIQTKLIRESEMQLPIRSCLLDYLRVAIKLQWDSNLTRVERIDFNQQDTFVTDVIQFRSSLNMNTFLNNLGKSDLTLPSWLQICARHDKNEKMFYSLWIDADLRTDQTHCQVNIFHVNPRDVRDKQVKDAPITFKLREVYDLFYPHHVGENIPYLQQVSFLEIGRFYHAWKEFLSFFNVKHTGHFDRQGFIEHRKKYFKVLEANKNKMIDGFTIAGVVENAEYEKGFIYFIISCPQAETFKFSLRTEDDDKDFEHIELKSFTSEQLEHARNQPVDSMIKGFELLLQQKLEAEMTRAAQETNNSYNRVKKIVERLKKDLC